ILTTDFPASMSDLFRGRASTWSAGAPTSDHESDAPRGFDYADAATATAAAALALRTVTASTSAATTPVDQPPNNSNTGGVGGFHYSPSTAADLGSQEFSTSRHLVSDKTPESTTSDYPQNFFANTASSPSRGSRDWNANGGGGSGGSGGGFQSSSFSVLSVAASSPFGHHAEGGSGLLTPCGGGYGSSSPYTNGSCPQPQQQQQPGLHSGSPSSVGSQLSIPQPSLMSAQGAMASATTPTVGGGGSTPAVAPTGGGSGSAAKRPARRNPWGSETYSDLIAKAIESYPEKQATLQQIYDYISTNYTYFRERSDPPASAGWKNSIRHNLSLHDKFVKCPKASESSKSSYWRLNANSLNRPYVRRRTCSLDTPGSVAGGGSGGVGGKKAKSRLGGGGSGAAGSTSTAKRAAQMAAAAAAAAGGGGGGGGSRGEIKSGSGLYGGDDLLASLQSGGSSAAAVRSHLNSLSSGIASAFSIPSGGGSDTLLGLKPDPGPGLNHHPWTNSGFLTDRKPPTDELSALCKMQAGDSVSSSSLSLMSGGGGGGYEFQVPRPPPSSSTRSSFSSSGIGSDRGSSFFSPPPPPPPPQSGRYHHHHHHQAFPHDQQQRYGSLCDASPTATSTNTTPTTTYDQLTGILTGSAECLDGGADPFLRDDPHQLQHHHQPPPPPPSMSHHHHHHHHQHPPPPPPTNSHLHNLLMCGDSSGGVSGSALPSTIHGGNENQQQPLSSQDAMELRISLEIANRVKSGEMSSTMQQWAAVAASAARTVENGV
ncbi:Forkhead box protein O1-B, partial [Taenia solium]